MECDECREVVSAGLDGEDLPEERAAAAAHLEGCGACRVFAERAARVTRLARTRIAEPVPDLAAAVVAAAPPSRRPRIGPGALRVALAAVGVAQLALAVSGLLGVGNQHGVVELGGASAAHLAHESSAWNLAVGVGFLWVSAHVSRAASLLPVVAAFVGVLAATSVVDVLAHRVEAHRLVGHAGVVVGLVLLLMLRRTGGGRGGERGGDRGGAGRGGTAPGRWRAARPAMPRGPRPVDGAASSADHRAA